MELLKKKQLFRCLFRPIYISILCEPSFHIIKPLSVDFVCKTLNPEKPTSNPFYPPVSSTGSQSFSSFNVSISSSSSLIRANGQIRVFSVLPSDVENVDANGSDDSAINVTNDDNNASKVDSILVSEIVEIIKSGENEELGKKLGSEGAEISVLFVIEVFSALNSEKVSGMGFYSWARDKNRKLFKKADFPSLIINNCGFLEDYETMHYLLEEFSLQRICLSDEAFGFIPIVDKGSLAEPVKKVLNILKKVGGSSAGTGIFALISMLAKRDLFELAKTVIYMTEKRLSYYNILVLEKCRRFCIDEARELLEEMRRNSCAPDVVSYNYIISVLLKSDKLTEACEVLVEMEDKGCAPNAISFELLILFLCKLGKIDAANQLFDQMVSRSLEPRLETYSAFIKSYFHSEKYDEAYKFVISSGDKHRRSGNFVYNLLASLHLGKGNVVIGGELLIEMMDKNFLPYSDVYQRIRKRLFKLGKRKMVAEIKFRFLKLRSVAKVLPRTEKRVVE